MKTLDQVEELLEPLFVTYRGRQVGLGMVILSGILLFSAVVGAVHAWYGDLTIMQSSAGVATHVDDAANAEATLIAQIPATHLFGLAAEDDDFLPITSLQLHLTGIIKDSADHVSKVIVSEAGQPGKVFAVGDTLTSGIKIYSINEDGIVLEHNGKLEKLPLGRQRLQFQDKPKTLWQDN